MLVLLSLHYATATATAETRALGSLPFSQVGTEDGYAVLGEPSGAPLPFLAYPYLIGQWLSDLPAIDATNGVYSEPINGLDGTQGLASARGTWVATHGGGLDLDGNDWVVVADNDLLTRGDGATDEAMTIAVFCNLDADNCFLATKRNDNTAQAEYQHQVSGATKAQWIILDETVNDFEGVASSGTVFLNTDLLLIYTYDGRGGTSANAGMKIYTNGILHATGTLDAGSYTAMTNTTAAFLISAYTDAGGARNNAWNVNGRIWDVMLFDKELTVAEGTNLFDYVSNN